MNIDRMNDNISEINKGLFATSSFKCELIAADKDSTIISEISKNIAKNVDSYISDTRFYEIKSRVQNNSYFVNSSDLADKILGKF